MKGMDNNMKLLYLLWGYSHDEEIIRAFEGEGLIIEKVDFLQIKNVNNKLEKEWDKLNNMSYEEANFFLDNKLANYYGDIIFSINFSAQISNYCQKKGIPYCSWVLQLPNYDLYTTSVFNVCNYIGICDSYLVEKMWKIGVEKAYFLPDAIELGEKISEVFEEREFCFVAKHPTSILNADEMSMYGRGYLDSFIHAQRVLYGANILEEGLISRVYQEVVNCNPIPENILPNMQKLYVADQYLAPLCTSLQQNIFMKNNENIMTIYSNGEFEVCNAPKYAFVEEEVKRRELYAKKEFTLVLAPHVFHNGMPREVLEVIAAGGFPVCGYQKDYAYLFRKDENLAFFTTMIEFRDIIVNYGNDQSERERVKENAYKLVATSHTYRNRIISMLEMWSKF